MVIFKTRYWGEPIPVVTAKNAGSSRYPKKELPIRLPDDGI